MKNDMNNKGHMVNQNKKEIQERKITRAIISMFNNSLNKNAQLIATLHDISLLDCKKMFRKEKAQCNWHLGCVWRRKRKIKSEK